MEELCGYGRLDVQVDGVGCGLLTNAPAEARSAHQWMSYNLLQGFERNS